MSDDAAWSSLVSELVDALPEAVLLLDEEGLIHYLNRASVDLLGHEAAELQGRAVSVVLGPQAGQRIDAAAWLRRWAQDPNSPQMRYLTLTGRTRAGALLRLSVRVARLSSPACYVVTLRDVTAEQREHLDTKHAYLTVSRILAISDDAIVNLDANQNITFFNRKAETLFGYRADEVLGRAVDVLLPVRFRASHAGHVKSFRHGASPSRLMGERGEIVGLTRNGTEVPLEASITKVFIEGVPTFSAQLRDISGRKAAERALTESEARFRCVFDNALEPSRCWHPMARSWN
ncbi:MAG: PAS domain S-box protein [Gammaproteobacteria bacterium]|nr:PAS domain S-box protein [Gammaproteobacteria bacterium]